MDSNPLCFISSPQRTIIERLARLTQVEEKRLFMFVLISPYQSRSKKKGASSPSPRAPHGDQDRRETARSGSRSCRIDQRYSRTSTPWKHDDRWPTPCCTAALPPHQIHNDYRSRRCRTGPPLKRAVHSLANGLGADDSGSSRAGARFFCSCF